MRSFLFLLLFASYFVGVSPTVQRPVPPLAKFYKIRHVGVPLLLEMKHAGAARRDFRGDPTYMAFVQNKAMAIRAMKWVMEMTME